jgi:hypothetical protein
MKAVIGQTAGEVWKTLSENEELSVARLPKILKSKPLIIHLALGWLVREDKIVCRPKGNTIMVSLTEFERKL